MEHLSNEASNSNICDRNRNIDNDQLIANYDVGNAIIYNTEVLKSNLCDYNDAYILARSNINTVGDNEHQVAFKYCAPFTKRIIKVYETTIDDAEDLDITC